MGVKSKMYLKNTLKLQTHIMQMSARDLHNHFLNSWTKSAMCDSYIVWQIDFLFNSLSALSYYGNDIITRRDMRALSLGRNVKIILMSFPVNIMQFNENCSKQNGSSNLIAVPKMFSFAEVLK